MISLCLLKLNYSFLFYSILWERRVLFPRQKLWNVPWKYITCIGKTLWSTVMSMTTLTKITSVQPWTAEGCIQKNWYGPRYREWKQQCAKKINKQENGLKCFLQVLFLYGKNLKFHFSYFSNALLKDYCEGIFWGQRNCIQSVMPWCLARCLWNYTHTHTSAIFSEPPDLKFSHQQFIHKLMLLSIHVALILADVVVLKVYWRVPNCSSIYFWTLLFPFCKILDISATSDFSCCRVLICISRPEQCITALFAVTNMFSHGLHYLQKIQNIVCFGEFLYF